MSKMFIIFALLLAVAYSTEAVEASPMFGFNMDPLAMISQINSNINKQMIVMSDPKNLKAPGTNGMIMTSYMDSTGKREGFIATNQDGKYKEMHYS